MKLKANVKPITYLKNHTADLVREVSEAGRPVLITQNGEAKVVVIDVPTYDRWRDALALLKVLAHSEGEVAAGRTLSQARVFRRAEAAISAAAEDE